MTDLQKCQKFNHELMRYLTGLIREIDRGNPPPNPATLKLTLETIIREATIAAYPEAVEAAKRMSNGIYRHP